MSIAAFTLLASAAPLWLSSVRGSEGPAPRTLLAIIRPPHRQPVLTRLDPLSLEPIGPQVDVGEYHYGWSLSPERSRLALATGGPRGSLRIVDLERMKVVRDVRCGMAAEALGWLTPDRLVAALQGGGIVVVDPTTGEIVHRRSISVQRGARMGPQKPAIRTRRGLVVLLTDRDRLAPAVLALAEVDGGLRTVSLDQIQAGSRPTAAAAGIPAGGIPEGAGLALDPDRQRVSIVAARAPVAEVELETMLVRYRPLPGLSSLDSECPAKAATQTTTACSSTRRILRIGDEMLAVFGANVVAQAANMPWRVPAGVALIDTRRWTVRMVEPKASEAAVTGTTLLVYGGEARASRSGIGLRAYRADGRPQFHLFGQELVYAVRLASGYAYAINVNDVVRIVDLGSGNVVREIKPSWTWIDLIDERD